MANISVEMVLGMLFLTLNNADIQIAKKKLIWKSYTIAKVLLITKRVELIDKKKFAIVALDEKPETFVIHVTSIVSISVYPDRKA